MKYCKYCKKFLDENEFYQYRNICKNCYCKKTKKYYQLNYQLDPDRWKEYNKRWREENPERYRELIMQGNIRWRKRNPEKYNECCKKWRKKNADKIKERRKKYRKEHPEKRREYRKRSNARRRKKGYIPIMINPFPPEINIDMHHIRPNLPFVIPIPKITHQYEMKNIEKHIEFNDYQIKKIYLLDITLFSGNIIYTPPETS